MSTTEPRPESLPPAESFRQLADRFESLANADLKVQHLALQVSAYSVTAGRLLLQVAEQGAFSGDPWWRPSGPGNDFGAGRKGPWKFESDEERYGLLWTFAIGSWLVKRYPEVMRHQAGELDWKHYKWDAEERRAICREEAYSEEDAGAHAQARALVYADACRILVRLTRPAGQEKSAKGKTRAGPIYINEDAVRYGGAKVDVTKEERNLLIALANDESHTSLSDDELWKLWGDALPAIQSGKAHNALKTRISRLSKKFGRVILSFRKDKWERPVSVRIASSSPKVRSDTRDSLQQLPYSRCSSCDERFQPFECQLCETLISDRCGECHGETAHGIIRPSSGS